MKLTVLFVIFFAVVQVINGLDHNTALSRLTGAGITVSSSGNCSNKTRNSCTSLDGIRENSISGIIAFKRASGCEIVVTGGTETGHEPGQYSHANGYKIDIRKRNVEPCLSNYITANFRASGKKWTDDSGNVYYDENNTHWDITYY